MTAALWKQVIGEALGSSSTVVSERRLSGGCIHDSRQVSLSDGRRLAVKLAAADRWPWLVAEAQGLAAIASTGTIRTPEVLALHWSPSGECGVLILAWIDSATPQARDFSEFAERLATLHRHPPPSQEFGFIHDNYLGATPQRNAWSSNWLEFWRTNRWRYQLELATHQGSVVQDLLTLGRYIDERLESLISEPEQPSLIHGDLWSGNILFDRTGQAVLIDPAVYYADREAEWGMLLWLGGLPHSFIADYNRVWPLREGFELRNGMYQLFHLFNHANLFGGAYWESTLQALRRLVRQLRTME